MRDAFRNGKLLKKMVKDLKFLLEVKDQTEPEAVMNLWDNKEGLQKYGVQYQEVDKE